MSSRRVGRTSGCPIRFDPPTTVLLLAFIKRRAVVCRQASCCNAVCSLLQHRVLLIATPCAPNARPQAPSTARSAPDLGPCTRARALMAH
eukprot:332124-Chlamydomonas_euryale.AAC.1